MSDLAIRAQGLGKQYRIGAAAAPYCTLREQLGRALAAPLRSLRRSREPGSDRTFWALRDVSLEIKRGEVVGVIGRNGAGKSTLLKILSRITDPTEGAAEIHGRVGSLLEVGTGFHPELTGRENIYLNGAILGMRRAEIGRKFDQIVAFAEVDKFIDTPMKYYSSGMYTRLAFAVAAYLEPEILVVDEVLAVGDAEFQKKCLGKMGEVARGGRTVLFVSHNLAAVRQLCSHGLVLEAGQVVMCGSAGASVDQYLARSRGKQSAQVFSLRHHDSRLTLKAVTVDPDILRFGDSIRVNTSWEAKEQMQVAFEIVLRDQQLNPVAFCGTGISFGYEYQLAPGHQQVCFRFDRLPLAEGSYSFDIMASHTNREFLVYAEEAIRFTVEESDPLGTGLRYRQGNGSVFFPCVVETPARQVRINL